MVWYGDLEHIWSRSRRGTKPLLAKNDNGQALISGFRQLSQLANYLNVFSDLEMKYDIISTLSACLFTVWRCNKL